MFNYFWDQRGQGGQGDPRLYTAGVHQGLTSDITLASAFSTSLSSEECPNEHEGMISKSVCRDLTHCRSRQLSGILSRRLHDVLWGLLLNVNNM
jgi:hypothetical protein